MELPRGYISYNQIKLYQQCPKQYFHKYIEGLESSLDEKVFLGIIFHASVEAHLKRRINGLFTSAKETVEHFNLLFKQEQEQYRIDWHSSKNDVRLRGEALLRHYLKELDGDIDPMLVEEEMAATIPELGVQLRGVLDLVEKDFNISDFKTATVRWSKERARSSFLQMVIYRYLFEQRFGPVTAKLMFRVIYSKSTRSARSQVIAFPAAEADFTQMIQVISYVVQAIRSESFYPNPSYRCSYCGFRSTCNGAKPPA